MKKVLVSLREDQIEGISLTGLSRSGYIREAVDEKLARGTKEKRGRRFPRTLLTQSDAHLRRSPTARYAMPKKGK